MSSKIKIGVLMGGISTEHSVSLDTGILSLQNLDPDKYLGFPIIITPENDWIFPNPEYKCDWKNWSVPPAISQTTDDNWYKESFPNFSHFPSCDMMFLALHGYGGEDGTIQGFLDLAGQKYTGSPRLGSSMAMDKIKSKNLMEMAGIPVADSKNISIKGVFDISNITSEFEYPVVLKDPIGGSSIGVFICKDEDELRQAIEELKKSCTTILVEEFIQGREAACGYIENYENLPPTEIIPKQDSFFNYEAKYDPKRTLEITPGNFPKEIISELQVLAKSCHEIHHLSVYSRTDFIVRDNKIYVLEINSLPGMTQNSLLPKAAECVGLDFQNLVSKIIEESFKKSE